MGDHDKPKTHEVANPEYEALEELKQDVLRVQDDIAHALKTPAQLMNSDAAWTGATTAETFAGEVSGRDGHLPGLMAQILSAVEDRMSEVDKTITVSDTPAGPHRPVPMI